jgi:protein-disulfide isomerase
VTASLGSQRLTLLMLVAAAIFLGIVIKQRAFGNEPEVDAGSTEVPNWPISLEGAALDGDRQAKVAVLVYSDFLCPACGIFAREVLPELRTQYLRTGKVLLAYRHFPANSDEGVGVAAASAAHCAGEQRLFWQMHDGIFSRPAAVESDPSWVAMQLEEMAVSMGVTAGPYRSCLERASRRVFRDAGSGMHLDIGGTPSFFIGPLLGDGRLKAQARFFGVRSLSDLSQAIEEAAKTAESWK